MSLTQEEVNGMTKREMILYIRSHEERSSIDVFGVKLLSIVCKLQNSELREVLLGIPYVRNEIDPSWYDLFTSVRERGIVTHSVTKIQMRKLLDNFNALREMRFDELLECPPTAINLRIVASRFGYVECGSRLKKLHEYCEMVGLPCIKYGYQSKVILLAKYFGHTSAESLPAKFSAEFLGIQPYPKTINELADIDEERFNRDVIIVRASLKNVVHRMERKKLVKMILAKYEGYRYLTITSQELDNLLG